MNPIPNFYMVRADTIVYHFQKLLSFPARSGIAYNPVSFERLQRESSVDWLFIHDEEGGIRERGGTDKLISRRREFSLGLKIRLERNRVFFWTLHLRSRRKKNIVVTLLSLHPPLQWMWMGISVVGVRWGRATFQDLIYRLRLSVWMERYVENNRVPFHPFLFSSAVRRLIGKVIWKGLLSLFKLSPPFSHSFYSASLLRARFSSLLSQ